MFDFSRTFRGVNTDFFFYFSDIFLISPTSDPSDFLLNRAVRAVSQISMYYAETRTDNSGHTNHRVTCLLVMGSPFDSEQVC